MTTRISITLADIVSRGACVEGTTFFASLSPSEVTDVDWTVDTQITWLRRSAVFVSWAMRRGLVPMLPMHGADLREATLPRADLSGADLRGADLYGADLPRADLSEAIGLETAIGYTP